MIEKVFSVSGSKINSMIIDTDSLKFSSKEFSSIEAFMESWGKKLSLATKVEVKLSDIKAIKKEENNENITVVYNGFTSFEKSCVFKFNSSADYDVFFGYFTEQKQFLRTEEVLTPFNAIRIHLLMLAISIVAFVIAYFRAVNMENGIVEESAGRRTRLFDAIIKILGVNGVLVVGVAIVLYGCYSVWKRYTNPPMQLKLTPQ